MARIKSRDHLTGSQNKIRIDFAYDQFLRSKLNHNAKRTIENYAEYKDRYVRWFADYGIVYVDDISTPVLRNIITDYAETHSQGGVCFMYRHLRCFINWAWDEYDIDKRSPTEKINVKTPHNPPKEGITRSEINALLQAVKQTSKFPERDTAIISFLADTGLRRSSVVSIRMKDLQLQNNSVLVFEKDQRFHIKPFGASTGKALRRYLDCLEDVKPDDPLWLNLDGSVMAENSMRMMLQRMADAAGIARHLFHDFRRFYGLELYKQTKDIYFVSRALDHKDIEVTKRYLAIDQLEDAEAMRLVSPMDNGKMTGIRINRKK